MYVGHAQQFNPIFKFESSYKFQVARYSCRKF